MAHKKTDKPLVYPIDKGNKIRSVRAVVRDMLRCDIVILLGDEKTHQMWTEEKIAWRMGMVILYRPAVKTFEELMEVGIFPEHQIKRHLKNRKIFGKTLTIRR